MHALVKSKLLILDKPCMLRTHVLFMHDTNVNVHGSLHNVCGLPFYLAQKGTEDCPMQETPRER